MARKLFRKLSIYFDPPSQTCALDISAGVDGGLSGGSSMRRPGTEDPHRRQWKLFCIISQCKCFDICNTDMRKVRDLEISLQCLKCFEIGKFVQWKMSRMNAAISQDFMEGDRGVGGTFGYTFVFIYLMFQRT
jgi:hypothetical protein